MHGRPLLVALETPTIIKVNEALVEIDPLRVEGQAANGLLAACGAERQVEENLDALELALFLAALCCSGEQRFDFLVFQSPIARRRFFRHEPLDQSRVKSRWWCACEA